MAVLFSLMLYAPTVQAACPTGCYEASGNCYQNTTGLACASVTTPPSTDIKLNNPLNSGECAPNGDCLMNFLGKILEFVIRIGTVVVVLMLVYVGFLFVTAQGEPGKITTARQALLWTVVGALILLGSQVIAMGIKATVQALSVGQ